MANDDIARQLRQDFLNDARDCLAGAQAALDAICAAPGADGDAPLDFRRQIHSLKGLGNAFGFPTISLLAHRLEDYLADVEQIDSGHARPVQVFLDHIEEILDAGVDEGMASARDLVRALPSDGARAGHAFAGNPAEVVLVTPSGVLSRAVKARLAGAGMRVTVCKTPWAALENAVCAHPDLVITSVVMDHISGIDLACALSQIEATAKTPMIVLTSFPPGHPQLRRLPAGVRVIEVGQRHLDALAETAAELVSARTVPETRPQGRTLDILLADDKNANRLLVEMIVCQAGHSFTGVENGAEAVRAVVTRVPDLVLMDIQMPVMDGVEATRAIRALPGAASAVPVVALTASDSAADVQRFRNAGMNDHVAKPIQRATLMAAIARQTGVDTLEAADSAAPSIGESRPPQVDDETVAHLEDFIDSL